MQRNPYDSVIVTRVRERLKETSWNPKGWTGMINRIKKVKDQNSMIESVCIRNSEKSLKDWVFPECDCLICEYGGMSCELCKNLF